MRRAVVVIVLGMLAFVAAVVPASASATTIESSRSAELAYYGVTAIGLLEASNPEAILATDIDAGALTGSPTTGAYTATTASGVATMAGITSSELADALDTTVTALPASTVAWVAPLANGDQLAIFDPGYWESGQTIVGWFVPVPAKEEPKSEPPHEEHNPPPPTTHEEPPSSKTTNTPESTPTPTTTATTTTATTTATTNAPAATVTKPTAPRYRVVSRRAGKKFVVWTVYAPSAGKLLVHGHVIRTVHHAGIVTVRVKRGARLVWHADASLAT